MMEIACTKTINRSELEPEIRVSFPIAVVGWDEGRCVNVQDVEDTANNRRIIQNIIDAHDPEKQSDEQKRLARKAAAKNVVNTADLDAIEKSIAAAAELDALKPVLQDLVNIVGDLCVALEFTPTVPTEETP